MIKAIIFMAVGAVAYHLYQHPEDKDLVINKTASVINAGATKVKEYSEPTTVEKIKELVK